MDDFFEATEKQTHTPVQVAHLHRKLFLLVFAITLLIQGWLLADKGLAEYHAALQDSFKVVLTLDGSADNAQLETWGQELNNQPSITQVRLFSPEDAMAVVRHKNPQLADSLLQLGKNKMPAYFEIKLTEETLPNLTPFLDNLTAQYPALTPYYHAGQARLLFYTGLVSKLVRTVGALILLAFIAFMLFVEAAPYKSKYTFSGAFSGLLAAAASSVCVAAAVYPVGVLADILPMITSWGRQGLLLTFGALLGWTLAKWQRF